MTRRAPKLRWVVVALLLAAWALRVVGLGRLALTGDEAYFILWGQRLDWAYHDHPGGMGLLAWLSVALGGGSEFGARWANACVGTLTVVLTDWIGRRMLRARAGLLAAAAVALGAPYIVTARVLATNPLHLALMLLSIGAVWRLLSDLSKEGVGPNGPGLRGAWLAGMSLALLFNTKYTAYLFAATLALGVWVWHRGALRRPHLWIAAGIAILGLLPVLIWNAYHDWGSFRWQLNHLVSPSPGGADAPLVLAWLRNLRHAVLYFTWPLAAVVALGLGDVRGAAQRLLSLVAAVLLLPVALSPANSPRNLTTGAVFLLLLAGDRVDRWLLHRARSTVKTWTLAAAASLSLIAAYGIGSGVAMARPQVASAGLWPHSSAVPLLLADAMGWRSADQAFARYPDPLYAIDYSLAGQLQYYTARKAYTAWPQYRLWGIPALTDVTIVAADYLPVDALTVALGDVFDALDGPQRVVLGSDGTAKVLWVWEARGLRIDTETFLDRFDFLTLAETLP